MDTNNNIKFWTSIQKLNIGNQKNLSSFLKNVQPKRIFWHCQIQ